MDASFNRLGVVTSLPFGEIIDVADDSIQVLSQIHPQDLLLGGLQIPSEPSEVTVGVVGISPCVLFSLRLVQQANGMEGILTHLVKRVSIHLLGSS